MDTFLIKAAQLILAFAILVIIHEFGHFFFARIFGVKVEKFYIFFDPWIELFKWKPKKYFGGLGKTKKIGNDDTDGESAEPVKKKRKKSFWGDTEYGIGWLPLGGYCKIAGMIDESMDTEQMKKPAQEWEFRSKPAWQRLLIMIAGVLFNFLLAILIYAGLVYATGEKYVPVQEAKMGFSYSGEARKIGFHNGDIPLAADGEELENPVEARIKMVQAKKVTVLRDGKDTVSISIPEKFIFSLDEEAKSDTASVNFFTYRFPTRITQVMPGEGAAKAGIEPGDEIIAIGEVKTPSLDEFFRTLPGHSAPRRRNDRHNCETGKAVGKLQDGSRTRSQPGGILQDQRDPLQHFPVYSPRNRDGNRQAHLLCQVYENGLHQRGSQQHRRFRIDRLHLPGKMGLDRILEHSGVPLGGSCVHEHPSDSGS